MLVLLTSAILTGCADGRLREAAARQGEARVGWENLPPMPADCVKEESHAELSVGMEALVALKNERRATSRANARIRRCNGPGGFYDSLTP